MSLLQVRINRNNDIVVSVSETRDILRAFRAVDGAARFRAGGIPALCSPPGNSVGAAGRERPPLCAVPSALLRRRGGVRPLASRVIRLFLLPTTDPMTTTLGGRRPTLLVYPGGEQRWTSGGTVAAVVAWPTAFARLL